PKRGVTELARQTSEIFELVVPGRSLLRARSPAHRRFCYQQPTNQKTRAVRCAQPRIARAGRSDDPFGMELYAREFAALGGTSVAHRYWRNGCVRGAAAGGFVSRLAALGHSGDHAHLRPRRDARDDEIVQSALELVECSGFSAGDRGWWR